jgi:hypothetical protein
MTMEEASFKKLKAYKHDNDADEIVVYVIDNSGEVVFTALRDYKRVWHLKPDVTVGDLADDYSLILDYAEVGRLVAEAKTSLSV